MIWSRRTPFVSWIAAFLLLRLCSSGLALASTANLPGTELLNDLDHLVVVYPAGPGEDVEINRLSGRRRAGFLTHLFGYETEYVADDAVTKEQLGSHLLVLGWNNRLLGTERAPRPFVTEGDGWRFLDGVSVRPGQDLMFSTASPYNPNRRLFFWTRIDLELDKFSVLPFLGSDWAVYRGYEVVVQGMFEDLSTWPPIRNTYAEMTNDDFRATYPVQGRSSHYTIRYPHGLIDEAQRDAILKARERALTAALASVGRTEKEMQIDLYLFADVEVKEVLSGVPDPMHSLGRSVELFMLPKDALSDSPHEEAHLIAQQVYGPCHHTALHEGLAMIAGREGSVAGLSVYAAALVDQDILPTISELLDEDGVRALNRHGLGFPSAAMLVRWILEVGGKGVLKEIYSARPLSLEQLAEALEVTPESADEAFRQYVRKLGEKGDKDFRFQLARTEARQLGKQGDWNGAVEKLTLASQLRPEDLDTLYRLALAEIRADRLVPAEGHLRRLLEVASRTEGAPERYVIFGHYQLGQVFQRTGRGEQAREQYRMVLEMPDRHGSHRMARESLGEVPD